MNENEFRSLKPGQVLRRIGPDSADGEFVNGRVYIVTKIDNIFIYFSNGNKSFKHDYFELVDKSKHTRGLPNWF